ncbi:MAG TPA: CBS domain-containing protein [Candidatus Baltobacteraceae bacterium]|nr:CBS domain-containing protein [Candidatus Baltobacteraceae bacterium]
MLNLKNIPSELVTETETFDIKTPITQIIPVLKKYPSVLINKGKEYYGVVDARTIYRARPSLTMSKGQSAEKFAVVAPKITNSTSLDDLVYYFYRTGVKALPFMVAGKVTGVLERNTLLKILLSTESLKEIRIGEAMTTPVLGIAPTSSLSQAKAAMRDNKVNRLVVVEGKHLRGIITNHDIIHKYMTSGQRLPVMKTMVYSPSNVPVSSIMEADPLHIDEGKSLVEGVRILIENKVSSVIVVKRDAPVGILTVTDVLESVMARTKIKDRRVFLSGLDQHTYGYEDQVREELAEFIDSMEKMSKVKVDYITMRVKGIKGEREYELYVRLSLGRQGIITISTTKFLFTEAFKDMMKKLKEQVRKEKEKALTVRKVTTQTEMEE